MENEIDLLIYIEYMVILMCQMERKRRENDNFKIYSHQQKQHYISYSLYVSFQFVRTENMHKKCKQDNIHTHYTHL